MLGLLGMCLVLGIAVGYSRGGRLSNLALPSFRLRPVLLVALAVRLALYPEAWQASLGVAQWGDQLYAVLDGLVILFLAANLHVPGMPIVAAGQACNLLAKLVNGGKMPVDPVIADKIGYLAEAEALSQQGMWIHSRFIDAQTRLPFLGDVIYVGPPNPWPRVVMSIGDLLLLLGVIVCIQGLMCSRSQRDSGHLSQSVE